MSRVDTAIRAAAGITVVGLAGISGAISYSHMAELASAHGEIGWRAHMFPLSVDGIEIVASLVLLADKRARRSSGWLPWAALITGTAASFAANVAVGGSDWIGRAVSGWPAFALLIAVKLLFGLLDHPNTATSARPVPASVPDRPPVREIVPGVGDDLVSVRDVVPTRRDGTDDRPDQHHDADDDRSKDGKRQGGQSLPADVAPDVELSPELASVLPSTPDVSALMPAARTARVALHRNGQALTREGLARQLRADGHAASNAKVSALVKALAAEPQASVQEAQRVAA